MTGTIIGQAVAGGILAGTAHKEVGPMGKERIQIGDIDMCYQQMGSGPPLVMIMGYTANMDWWNQDLLELLSAEYSLLLMDNRGAGRTSSGKRTFTIKRFADDTAMLMAELGIGSADILGASMGGMIAQELAINYPGKTDRLVLMCTSCGGPHMTIPSPHVAGDMLKRYPTPEEDARAAVGILYPREWIEAHPEKVQETIEMLCRNPISPANGLRQGAAILMHNTYSRLPSIESKTLVMCGDSDVILPPKNSRTIAGRIPGAKLRVFAGGGHGFPTQFTDDVASEVKEFLAR